MVSLAVVGTEQAVAQRKAGGLEQARQIIAQGVTAAAGARKGAASKTALSGIVIENRGGLVGTTGATPTVPAPAPATPPEVKAASPPVTAPSPRGPAKGTPAVLLGWSPPTRDQARAANDAVLRIHNTLPEKSRANTVYTLSFSPDGRVILSANRSGISQEAKDVAKEMYPNIEFVPGGISRDAPGPEGWHAEPRGGQDLPPGTYQASSHYSCEQCQAFQHDMGYVNVTGFKTVTGRVTR